MQTIEFVPKLGMPQISINIIIGNMFESGIRGTMAEFFFLAKSPRGSPSRQKPRQSRVAHCQCSSSPHPRRAPLWHALLFWQEVTSQLRLIQRDCAGTKQQIRAMRNVLLCRILDTIDTVLIQYWFNMIQSSHSAWLFDGLRSSHGRGVQREAIHANTPWSGARF
jgi:hypothetical protein